MAGGLGLVLTGKACYTPPLPLCLKFCQYLAEVSLQFSSGGVVATIRCTTVHTEEFVEEWLQAVHGFAESCVCLAVVLFFKNRKATHELTKSFMDGLLVAGRCNTTCCVLYLSVQSFQTGKALQHSCNWVAGGNWWFGGGGGGVGGGDADGSVRHHSCCLGGGCCPRTQPNCSLWGEECVGVLRSWWGFVAHPCSVSRRTHW